MDFTGSVENAELRRVRVDHGEALETETCIVGSNQENPGGSWVFPQPTPCFTDLLAAGSG